MKRPRDALVLILPAALMINSVSCARSAPSKIEPTPQAAEKNRETTMQAEGRYASRPAEFITIRNPHALEYTGSPRDAAQVETEMNLGRGLMLAFEDYLRMNGLRKTVSELNKGRSGELGRYMPETYFYLSFSVNQGERMHWKIIAHPTLPAAVGYDIPDLGMIRDNTGWAYNTEMLNALDDRTAQLGLIENIIWTDPEWGGHSCRMNAYNDIFEYEGTRYTLYFAVWLDR